jgi:hypothetical protein
MDQVIVTASSSNLGQAIEAMIIIREEMESFRPVQYSDSDSSSGEAGSGDE